MQVTQHVLQEEKLGRNYQSFATKVITKSILQKVTWQLKKCFFLMISYNNLQSAAKVILLSPNPHRTPTEINRWLRNLLSSLRFISLISPPDQKGRNAWSKTLAQGPQLEPRLGLATISWRHAEGTDQGMKTDRLPNHKGAQH